MNFFGSLFASKTQQKRRSIVPTVKLRLESLEERAVPTTLTMYVIDSSDSATDFTATPGGGSGSLRGCITAANNNSGANNSNSIILQANPIINSGEPGITCNLTIEASGAGADILSGTGSNANLMRLFSVGTNGVNVGNLTISGCEIKGGYNAGQGGAVATTASGTQEHFINDVFDNNQAAYGGAISNQHGATCTISVCKFKQNTASSDGGAINNTGNMTFVSGAGNTISNNAVTSSTGCGGGIYCISGSITINSSVVYIHDNFAGHNGFGGGIYTEGAGLITTASITMGSNGTVTLAHNEAYNGAGIYENQYSNVDMSGWLFQNNVAGNDGGAAYFRNYSTTTFGTGSRQTTFGTSGSLDTATTAGPGGFYVTGASWNNLSSLVDNDDGSSGFAH